MYFCLYGLASHRITSALTIEFVAACTVSSGLYAKTLIFRRRDAQVCRLGMNVRELVAELVKTNDNRKISPGSRNMDFSRSLR